MSRQANIRVENINFEAICPTYFGVPPVAYASDSGTTKTMLRNCEFTGTGQAASMSSQKDFPGYYENCKANNSAFGYSGEASGTFVNCTAGNCSFGYYRKASGTFTNCIGGTYCFGAYGTASGTFTNCTGDSYSFGTASYSGTSYASGTFTNCVAGDYSFGARGYGSLSSSHVTGTFVNCAAGSESFGGYWGDTTGGHFIGCRMTGATWSGMFNGHMENCRWSAGFSCNPGARIYNSTILGAINMNNVACGVTQSRCKALSNFGNNLFGATASAAMITVNSNVQ